MKIVIADDDAAMLARLKKTLNELDSSIADVTVCGEAINGKELTKVVAKHAPVDLVISDMRMPTMDGLSALAYIRHKFKSTKVVMLTSESKVSVTNEGVAAGTATAKADRAKQIALLEKIATRIRNEEPAGDKVATILEGCERLGMDPLDAARHFGASGYVRKPIGSDKMAEILTHVKSAKAFFEIGIATKKQDEQPMQQYRNVFVKGKLIVFSKPSGL